VGSTLGKNCCYNKYEIFSQFPFSFQWLLTILITFRFIRANNIISWYLKFLSVHFSLMQKSFDTSDSHTIQFDLIHRPKALITPIRVHWAYIPYCCCVSIKAASELAVSVSIGGTWIHPYMYISSLPFSVRNFALYCLLVVCTVGIFCIIFCLPICVSPTLATLCN